MDTRGGKLSPLYDFSQILSKLCFMDESILNDLIIEHFNKAEESIIMSVLERYIGHKPTKEDLKRITIIRYTGELNNYDLAIDGIKVGSMCIRHPDWFDTQGPGPYYTTIQFIPNASS